MTPKEHAIRRAVARFERGLPITLTLMAELMRYGVDVSALERQHAP
jgi:hypothetical protein